LIAISIAVKVVPWYLAPYDQETIKNAMDAATNRAVNTLAGHTALDLVVKRGMPTTRNSSAPRIGITFGPASILPKRFSPIIQAGKIVKSGPGDRMFDPFTA